MGPLSRRELLLLGLAVSAGLAHGDEAASSSDELHRWILDLAARLEKERRARFAAVRTKPELAALQESLRRTFLRLLGGLPERTTRVPPSRTMGRIEAEDYTVEKLVFESFPGYFVPALLYAPRAAAGPLPGVLSPCGHSRIGKAAVEYQTLHINLAKRGYVVLTYDPVGQAERSQFWDAAKGASRFNLGCGEHAVLGTALELLGTGLARYRIWDGMRGLDYLAARPEVDPARIGCVGNSGGGTLTAYITALDPRVAVAAIGCYITTLPRRMANRIQEDPGSDPEQDIPGFVGEGIDHAGLLALCAPRPTLVASARLDFFPIEGARETLAEARRLYEAAGAGERIAQVESPHPHGLTLPLREAVYAWFGRWLKRDQAEDPSNAREIAVTTRPATELLVCSDGQVNLGLRSRPLLPLALEEFQNRPKAEADPGALRTILGVDLDGARPEVSELEGGEGKTGVVILLVNGNESPDWREQAGLLQALARAGHRVAVVDPRGVGRRRASFVIKGREYSDPLVGVEANLAYNAFLVGRSLLGLRVSDVAAAVRTTLARHAPARVFLCGRRDAALVACLTAAVEPAIQGVAAEEMLSSLLPAFSPAGYPINAASILPGLLRNVGDLPAILARIAPRRLLLAAGAGPELPDLPSIEVSRERYTSDPRLFTSWLRS